MVDAQMQHPKALVPTMALLLVVLIWSSFNQQVFAKHFNHEQVSFQALTASLENEYTFGAQNSHLKVEEALLLDLDSSVEFASTQTSLNPLQRLLLTRLAHKSPDRQQALSFVRHMVDADQEFGRLDASSLQENSPNEAKVAWEMPSSAHANKPTLISNSTLSDLQIFASYSAAAYCRPRNLYPKWQCGYPRCTNPSLSVSSNHADTLAGTETISFFRASKTGSVGYVALNRRLDSQGHAAILIVFRGTMNIRNTIYDLRFAQARYNFPGAPDNARIHSGFWLIWQDVLPHVQSGLEEAMKRILERQVLEKNISDDPFHVHIVLTGHSMGGAIALLAGLELVKQIPSLPGVPFTFLFNQSAVENEGTSNQYRLLHYHFGFREENQKLETQLIISFKIYTYGEPRVGNAAFAQWVMTFDGLPVFRTTYYNDPIPHLPPRRLLPLPGPFQFLHRRI